MILNQKVITVMPAYNAEKTLPKTYQEIPFDIVDEVILVDDASQDKTLKIAQELGLSYIIHPRNSGYGANQKTCYKEALKRKADIIIMLHPDYQYTPRLIPAVAGMIASGIYDVILASRILGKEALKGGMPRYNYWANRFLTFLQNVLLRKKMSEFHSGYRAYSRKVLETVPFENNSDDFLFDNQLLLQAFYYGFRVGEVSCPTHYDQHSSTMSLSKSFSTAFGIIQTTLEYLLARQGLMKSSIYQPKKKELNPLAEKVSSEKCN